MRNFTFKDKYETLINELIEDFNKSHSYNYIMGPNALYLIEILCEKMDLKPGMRVLDMGCGAGFTSIILAKEYGVTVFANDLWFPATENFERFKKLEWKIKYFRFMQRHIIYPTQAISLMLQLA